MLRAIVALSILLVSASGSVAEEIDERPLLWSATRAGRGDLFLLGSLPAAQTEPAPLDPASERAYTNVDGLAFEIDFAAQDLAEQNDTLVGMAYVKDGTPLSARVPKETYARVQVALDALGRPPDSLDYFEPWFVGMVLSARNRAALRYRSSFALTNVLQERARGERKLAFLEDDRARVRLRAGFDRELQLRVLERTLEHLGVRRLEEMDEAYARRDVAALEAVHFRDLESDPALEPYFRRVVFDRNANMAERLEELSASGETWLAVLPIVHLVGDRSVLARLRERGYATERLAAKVAEEPNARPEP